MHKKTFQELLNPDAYQVFLFTCPATLPFGGIGRHPWFVVNRKGVISRWEIIWRTNLGATSWGHLYKNLYTPTQCIAKYFFSEKYFYNRDGRFEGYVEGDVARRMAEFIENSPNRYPYCDTYSLLGINSNTYAAWVLGNFPESTLRLPRNSFGRKINTSD